MIVDSGVPDSECCDWKKRWRVVGGWSKGRPWVCVHLLRQPAPSPLTHACTASLCFGVVCCLQTLRCLRLALAAPLPGAAIQHTQEGDPPQAPPSWRLDSFSTFLGTWATWAASSPCSPGPGSLASVFSPSTSRAPVSLSHQQHSPLTGSIVFR